MDNTFTTGVIPVRLQVAGGEQGTGSSRASWSYDVFNLDGSSLIMKNANPERNGNKFSRPNAGQMEPATFGLAFLDEDGEYALAWVNESMIVAEETE
jgi:hypothetical protein